MDSTKEKKGFGKIVSEAFMNKYRKSKKFRRFLKTLLVLIIIAVAVIVICAVFHIPEKIRNRLSKDKNISYTAESVQINYSPKGEWVIGATKGTAIICDESGVTAFDENGAWKWNRTLSVEEPAVFSGEGAMLLIDRKSGTVYAFGETGLMWRYNSDSPVKSAFINSDGTEFVALTDEGKYASVVKYFTVSDSDLTEVFTARLSKYYVLECAFSENAGQLALSCVYRSGEDMMSAIVFLKESNGEIFDTVTAKDCVYGTGRYIGEETLFTAETGSLRRIVRIPTASKKDDCDELLWERRGTRQKLAGACAVGNRYYAAAYSMDNVDESDSSGSEIVYYGPDGKEARRITLEGVIKDVKSYGLHIAVATEKTVSVYNVNGFLSSRYESEDKIEEMIPMDETHFTVRTSSEIFVITLREEK